MSNIIPQATQFRLDSIILQCSILGIPEENWSFIPVSWQSQISAHGLKIELAANLTSDAL